MSAWLVTPAASGRRPMPEAHAIRGCICRIGKQIPFRKQMPYQRVHASGGACTWSCGSNSFAGAAGRLAAS
eukprot:7219578-Prymnesium_polylepis.4